VRGDVENDQNGSVEVVGKRCGELRQGLDTAGRGSDGDDLSRLVVAHHSTLALVRAHR
jgi:hypothetical protein